MSMSNAGPYYPIGPFREWLIYQRDRHERLFDMSQREFTAMLGIDDRVLYRWLHEGHVVALDNVDRIVCAFGDPGLLEELCPFGQEVGRNFAQTTCPHGDEFRSRNGCSRCQVERTRERRRARREALAA